MANRPRHHAESIISLDIETTGLTDESRIYDIGITDYEGQYLYQERFEGSFIEDVLKRPDEYKTSPEISTYALRHIQQIKDMDSAEALAYARSLEASERLDPSKLYDTLQETMRGKQLWVYNLNFERRHIYHKSGFDLGHPKFRDTRIEELRSKIKTVPTLSENFGNYRKLLGRYRNLLAQGTPGAFDLMEMAKATMAVAIEETHKGRGFFKQSALALRGEDVVTGLSAENFAQALDFLNLEGRVGESHIASMSKTSDTILNVKILDVLIDISDVVFNPKKSIADLPLAGKTLLNILGNSYLENKQESMRKQMSSRWEEFMRGHRTNELLQFDNPVDALRAYGQKSLRNTGITGQDALIDRLIYQTREEARKNLATYHKTPFTSQWNRLSKLTGLEDNRFISKGFSLLEGNKRVVAGVGLAGLVGMPVLGLLTRQENTANTASSILSIVGMGGVGAWALSKFAPNWAPLRGKAAGTAGLVGAGLMAAGAITGFSFNALRDNTKAAEMRHAYTAFGSGYVGMDQDTRTATMSSGNWPSYLMTGIGWYASPYMRNLMQKLMRFPIMPFDMMGLSYLETEKGEYARRAGKSMATLGDWAHNLARRIELSPSTLGIGRILQLGTLASGVSLYDTTHVIEILGKQNEKDLIKYYSKLVGKTEKQFLDILRQTESTKLLYKRGAIYAGGKNGLRIGEALTTNVTLLQNHYLKPSRAQILNRLETGADIEYGYRSSLIHAYTKPRGINLRDEEFVAYPKFLRETRPFSFGAKKFANFEEAKEDFLKTMKPLWRDFRRTMSHYVGPYFNIAARRAALLAQTPFASVAEMLPEPMQDKVLGKYKEIINKIRQKWIPGLPKWGSPFIAEEGGAFTKFGAKLGAKLGIPVHAFAHSTPGIFWRMSKSVASLSLLPFAYKAIDDLMYNLVGVGPTQILATASGGIKTAFSAVSDITGLTEIAKTQEEAGAPTGPGGFLKWMLGTTGTGMVAGAAIGAAKNFKTELAAEGLERLKAVRGSTKVIQNAAVKGMKIGGLAGLLLGLPLGLGFLGSDKTVGEQIDELQGDTEVPVMKGRFWPMGRSPWEGTGVDYFAPSWEAESFDRSRIASLYGDSLKNDFLLRAFKESPILGDFYRPYYLEELHHEDRPYFVTGPSGEGAGLWGSLYEMSLGQIIKPTRDMHREAFIGLRGYAGGPTEEYGYPTVGGQNYYVPSGEIEGETMTLPETVSQYNVIPQLGEALYGATELMGLRGYMFASAFSTEQLGVSEPMVPSAKQMVGRRLYWDRSIGDPFATEFYRRVNPRYRADLQWANPLRNQMPEWLPGCFLPETKIETDRGLISIEEVRQTDMLYTHVGRYRKILRFYQHFINDDITKIQLFGNNLFPIECTKEHPFLAIKIDGCKYYRDRRKTCQPHSIRGNKPCRYCVNKNKKFEVNWIKANELEKGDVLLYKIPILDESVKHIFISDFVKNISFTDDSIRSGLRGSYKVIHNKITLDYNFGFVCGQFLAEGHASKYTLYFAHHIKEGNYSDAIQNWFTSINLPGSRVDKTTYIVDQFYSRVLANFFGQEFGKKENKKIPSWVFKSPDDFKKGFLTGYLNGDGSLGENNISAFTISLQVFYGIVKLLASYKIPLSYSYIRYQNNKDGYCFGFIVDKYFISNFPILKNKVLFYKQETHTARQSFIFNDEYIAFKIKKIENINYVGNVYNFETEEDNSYTVNFINVHNSNYFENFLEGDIYSSIPRGEERLPGAGYERRYPEVTGLDPELYPMAHKLSILGDTALWSSEFRDARRAMEDLYEEGSLTDHEKAMYEETMAQVNQQQQKINFRSEEGGGLLGTYYRTITDIARANPLEQILPFSPAHKFFGPMDVISHYKENVVYGNAFAPWNTPISSFISPAINKAMDIVGLDHIPDEVEQERAISEYFDKLEYVKFQGLARQAEKRGDDKGASQYAREARNTLVGLTNEAPLWQIMSALPAREKPYFEAFTQIEDLSDRADILDLVPEYVGRSLQQQWYGDVSERTEEDKMEELSAFFRDYRLPGPEWSGWSDQINLDDIKLKYVENHGLNAHNFGIWQAQIQAAKHKPYLDELADSLGHTALLSSSPDVRQVMENLGQYNYNSYEMSALASNVTNYTIYKDNTQKVKRLLDDLGE